MDPACQASSSSSSSSTRTAQHRFLLVGNACLDIINICPHYPEEDEDMRAADQEYRRGGNAANSSCVLSQLPQAHCSLLSTLPSTGWETEYVEKDLHEKHGVDLTFCVRHENCHLPTSYVVLSQATGSRTIVHHRKLHELRSEEFTVMPLHRYVWIHFEGRNVVEVMKMIAHVDAWRLSNPDQLLRTSVEVEKKRPELYELMGTADVVFVSKDVAHDLGHTDAESAVHRLHSRCRDGAVLVCAWGAHGADAYSRSTGHLHCDAFPPPALVDTLAAGDTFNAGVMYAMSRGAALFEALQLGCWLAGRKCGQMGVDNLLADLSNSDPVLRLLADEV